MSFAIRTLEFGWDILRSLVGSGTGVLRRGSRTVLAGFLNMERIEDGNGQTGSKKDTGKSVCLI